MLVKPCTCHFCSGSPKLPWPVCGGLPQRVVPRMLHGCGAFSKLLGPSGSLICPAVSAVICSTNTVRGWDLARLLQFQVWLDLCITHRSNTTNQQLAPRFRCDPCSMSSALPYSLCCNSPLNGNEHKDVRKLSFPIWKATQGPLLALCWGTVSLPDSFSRLVGVQSWDRSSKSPCPPPGWDEHL